MTPIISNATVVGLGVGLVFFGLICLIAICYLLGFVMRLIGKKSAEPAAAESVKSAVNAASPPDPVNRQELIAAVAAAIAEELGTDTEAIRIKSIRKL